ncbi:MAG: Asp-tRNA(Asn)/Glu-tRNA(Gln) amidotransferase subunit GatB [bacterium]
MNYEAVIGLEVHAQLFTRSKIFCGCSTEFGAPPNTHVCPVCLGLPGVLPVLNRRVVEMALTSAVALNFQVQERSIWERKNYFYPDLPKGYQISQYAYPLARHGFIEIKTGDKDKRVGITRLHLEEDAGKLVHSEDAFSRATASFVDFNRSGVPLMEIVSEPDLRSAEEAGAYLRALRNVLVYLEVCDGNMEQGSLRCDANVSVRPPGRDDMGTRTEIKNMNSFRNVEHALSYEIKRQAKVLEAGKQVVQETRLWDDREGKTVSMRGKEESHDYRYFPDPDLLPLVIDSDWTERVRKTLPELPMEKQKRFVSDYGIPDYDAGVLTSERDLADYYEAAVKTGADAKKTANWVMSELLRELKEDDRSIVDCPVSAEKLGALVRMIDSGEITGKIGKTVFAEMYKTGKSPAEVIEEQGLKPMADEGEVGNICDKVIEENPKQVKQYQEGKQKVLGFFVGQVMKATGGKADPQVVNRMLKQKLDEA